MLNELRDTDFSDLGSATPAVKLPIDSIRWIARSCSSR